MMGPTFNTSSDITPLYSGVAVAGRVAEVGPVWAAGHGVLPGNARQALQRRTGGLGHEVSEP